MKYPIALAMGAILMAACGSDSANPASATQGAPNTGALNVPIQSSQFSHVETKKLYFHTLYDSTCGHNSNGVSEIMLASVNVYVQLDVISNPYFDNTQPASGSNPETLTAGTQSRAFYLDRMQAFSLNSAIRISDAHEFSAESFSSGGRISYDVKVLVENVESPAIFDLQFQSFQNFWAGSGTFRLTWGNCTQIGDWYTI